MINAIKKLTDVAFERIALAGTIAALGPKHVADFFHTLMCPLADPTREGGRYKGGLEYRIEHFEDGVVEHSISNRGFVDAPQFWITNPEAVVPAVAIRFISEFSVQLKNMLLKIELKFCNVWLVPLVAFEYAPCGEQVLRRNY